MRTISHPVACTGLALLCAPLLAIADEGPVTAELGGRVHLDFAQFDNDNRGTPHSDDTEIRRLWLDVAGKFFGWGYKIEGDFAGLQDDFSGDSIEAKDVYINREFKAGRLTIGQFKQYFTLDDRIGSNDGLMMERGMYATSLAPLYRLGVAWITARDHYTLGGSIYSLERIDVWQTKGRAFALRGTWAPQNEDGSILHLGASFARENYDHPGVDGASALRIAPRPAGSLSNRTTLLSFDQGRDVDANKYSLEFGAVHGPWYLQSEVSGAEFDEGMQRGDIHAAYGQVGWTLTGESMAYDSKNGRFRRLQPASDYGAWVLALRYNTIRGSQYFNGAADFSDVAMEQISLGLNWHLRTNLRFMLDLIQSRDRDRIAQRTLDRTRALTGRFQYDF